MHVIRKFARVVMLCSALSFTAYAQQEITMSEEFARGIKLYKSGALAEAAQAFEALIKKEKKNSVAWHYLGLTHSELLETKRARKDFEQAIKLKPDFVAPRISLAHTFMLTNKHKEAEQEAWKVLQLEPDNAEANCLLGFISLRRGSPESALMRAIMAIEKKGQISMAWLLRSQALVNQFAQKELAKNLPWNKSAQNPYLRNAHFDLLKDAANCLELFLKLEPELAKNEYWREQLETLNFYAATADSLEVVSPASPGEQLSVNSLGFSGWRGPIVTNDPKPRYTQAAMKAGVTGVVKLMVVYGSDGKLKHILVLQGLDHGLTEEAIRAAKEIRFTPASRQGIARSVISAIGYEFQISKIRYF